MKYDPQLLSFDAARATIYSDNKLIELIRIYRNNIDLEFMKKGQRQVFPASKNLRRFVFTGRFVKSHYQNCRSHAQKYSGKYIAGIMHPQRHSGITS